MVNCTSFPSVSLVLTHPFAPIPPPVSCSFCVPLLSSSCPSFLLRFLFLPHLTPLALPSFVPAQFHTIPLIRRSLRRTNIELLQGKDSVIYRTFLIDQSSKRPRYAESHPRSLFHV